MCVLPREGNRHPELVWPSALGIGRHDESPAERLAPFSFSFLVGYPPLKIVDIFCCLSGHWVQLSDVPSNAEPQPNVSRALENNHRTPGESDWQRITKWLVSIKIGGTWVFIRPKMVPQVMTHGQML